MDYQKLANILFPHPLKTPEEWEVIYPPRNLPEGAVVTRLAPSPTGFVHLGNLVQGLTSERMAHQSGGVLFLRIEDTDAKREVPGAVEVLIRALAHYHIQFDEGATIEGDSGLYGPYRQRQRKEIYHTYAKKLVEEGKAYPCFATEDELASMHEQQEAEKANYGYYGKWATWRDRPMADIEAELEKGTPWVLRFRSEGSIEHKIKFTDLIKGNLEITENDIDHVLLKSDGIPTYHFAHAVDDHLMRTTHVVRGDEWLSTLPFHVQLFGALGFKLPKYLHIGPLQKMDGDSKRKLSKRKDPEIALTYYQQMGYPVMSVYEYILGVLNSNFEDWRRANPDANADTFAFSPKKMNPAGSLFDEAKLKDTSKNVISRMTAEEVYTLTLEWAEENDPAFATCLKANPEIATSALSIGRGGKKPRKDIAVWSEVKGYMGYLYDEFFVFEEFPLHYSKEDAKKAMLAFADIYSEAYDNSAWFEKVKTVAEGLGYTTDMKAYKSNPDSFPGSVADVSTFLRYAITGKLNSPDLCELMKILGKEKSLSRLARAAAQFPN
ncbi:MAG: glutamate--tRNA ligase [Clostridia bacterium]|nr:glutamate--tRNA ligase [Clostridia bacterium]